MDWEKIRLLSDLAIASMRARDEVWRAAWRQAARADGMVTPSVPMSAAARTAPAVRVVATVTRIGAIVSAVVALLVALGGDDPLTAHGGPIQAPVWWLIGLTCLAVALRWAADRLPALDFAREDRRDRVWSRHRTDRYGFDPFDPDAVPPPYDVDGASPAAQRRLEALRDMPFHDVTDGDVDEMRTLSVPLRIRRDTSGLPAQVSQALTVIEDL